jgi:hypothetical protein
MCSQARTNVFSKGIICNFTYFVAMTIIPLLVETRRYIFVGCNSILRLMLFVAWYEETIVFEHSNTEIMGSNCTRSVILYLHSFFVLSCVR